MARASVIRNHKGELDLSVSGHYVDGARVLGLSSNGEEMVAIVHIPLKALTLTERDDVVVSLRPERRE